MEERIEKYPVFSLLLLSAGLYFFNLNLMQVTIMEARNFIVAREILDDGNWLLTTMNGIPRYEKPPFPPWFTLPFIVLKGSNELFWFRIPTSVFATFGVLIMYYFLNSETGNRRLALFAAMILGTSLYYLVIRFEGPSDSYAHISMFGAIVLLFLFLKRSAPQPWFVFVAGLLTGVSILSKGPVSLYALLLPFLIACFLVYRIQDFRKKLAWLVVYLLISVVIGGSWYLYVRLMDPDGFMAVTSKETANWTSYNVKPFYFYWNFFIHSGVWAVPSLFSLMTYRLIKKVSPWFQLYEFSLIWMLLSVLLLSVIPEKKARYLVPVMFPLAINTAIWIFTFIRHGLQVRPKIFQLMKYLVFGLPAIPALLFPAAVFAMDIKGTTEWIFFVAGSLLFLVTGFMILRMVFLDRLVTGFYLIIILAVLVTTIGFRAVKWMPVNEGYRSPENFQNDKNLPVFAYEEIQPEVVWDLGFKVPPVEEEIFLAHEKPFLLLVSKDHEEAFLQIRSRRRTIKKVDTYDRNYFWKKNNQYRGRYILDVYQVE